MRLASYGREGACSFTCALSMSGSQISGYGDIGVALKPDPAPESRGLDFSGMAW